MIAAGNTLRWVMASALAVSLSVSPVVPLESPAGYRAASAEHAGAGCCCRGDCQCLVCDSHPQRSNERQNSPTVPTDFRDLAKIGQTVAYLPVTLTDSERACEAASHAASVRPPQTLVAQHACIQV